MHLVLPFFPFCTTKILSFHFTPQTIRPKYHHLWTPIHVFCNSFLCDLRRLRLCRLNHSNNNLCNWIKAIITSTLINQQQIKGLRRWSKKLVWQIFNLVYQSQGQLYIKFTFTFKSVHNSAKDNYFQAILLRLCYSL